MAPVQTDKTKESMVEVARSCAASPARGRSPARSSPSIMRNQTLGPARPLRHARRARERGRRIVNLGYPDDYFAQLRDARARARRERRSPTPRASFIRPDEIVWLVVGDLAKVEAGIRELKLGEVIRLDGDGRPLADSR